MTSDSPHSESRRPESPRPQPEPVLGLADRLALTDLVHRYAALVDAREYRAAAELFAGDGVLVAPAPPADLSPCREVVGRDAIEAEFEHLRAFDVTWHGLAGLVLTATGPDTASGEVRCEAHHVRSDGEKTRDLVWLLRYRDDYRRDASGWLLERRALTVDVVDLRPVKKGNPRAR